MSDQKDDGTTHAIAPLLTADQLGRIMPKSPIATRVADAAALCDAFVRTGTLSVAQRAMMLGQLAHESGELRYTREQWGPSMQQARYERDFAQPWDKHSANRLAFNLGNAIKGDGFAFRGWSWIQVTGRSNTRAASLWVYGDDRLTQHPELLDQRELAALGLAWFWGSQHINDLVDAGDARAVTTRINGAASDGPPSHHLRRIAYRDRAIEVLKPAA